MVRSYHGVPLDPEGRLAASLAAAARAVTGEALGDCPSPNCSEALELRGRWDAEIALEDEALRARYEAATAEVRATHRARERVSMHLPPRSSRYALLRRIRAHLGHDAGLGVGNLSLDYCEDATELPAEELLTTMEILHELHRGTQELSRLTLHPAHDAFRGQGQPGEEDGARSGKVLSFH